MENLLLNLTKGEAKAIREIAAAENVEVESLIIRALAKCYLRFGDACGDCLSRKVCKVRGKRRCNCSYYRKPPALGEHDGAKPYIPY